MEDWTWNIIEVQRRHILGWILIKSFLEAKGSFLEVKSEPWLTGRVRMGGQKAQRKEKAQYWFERTLVCLLNASALLPVESLWYIWVPISYSKVSWWNTSFSYLPIAFKCWLLQRDYRGWKTSCKEYYTENRFKF